MIRTKFCWAVQIAAGAARPADFVGSNPLAMFEDKNKNTIGIYIHDDKALHNMTRIDIFRYLDFPTSFHMGKGRQLLIPYAPTGYT